MHGHTNIKFTEVVWLRGRQGELSYLEESIGQNDSCLRVLRVIPVAICQQARQRNRWEVPLMAPLSKRNKGNSEELFF